MNIILYTKPDCVFCSNAKALLRDKQIPFMEYKLNEDFTREILLSKFPEASTYPVIVIDNFRIGGFNELRAVLNEESKNNNLKFLIEG